MGLLMISETINDIYRYHIHFLMKKRNLSCSLLSRLRTKNLQIS